MKREVYRLSPSTIEGEIYQIQCCRCGKEVTNGPETERNGSVVIRRVYLGGDIDSQVHIELTFSCHRAPTTDIFIRFSLCAPVVFFLFILRFYISPLSLPSISQYKHKSFDTIVDCLPKSQVYFLGPPNSVKRTFNRSNKEPCVLLLYTFSPPHFQFSLSLLKGTTVEMVVDSSIMAVATSPAPSSR